MSNPKKKKGTEFETAVTKYLGDHLNADVHREVLHGANDIGDITGVSFRGYPVAIECKNAKQQRLGDWLQEAERERDNAGAIVGVVVHKRPRKGITTDDGVGEQYVTMKLREFCRLVDHG